LLIRGQPAAGAVVRLQAADAKLARLCPHATVENDGTFRVTTFDTADGAPTGTYALTLTWPLPPRPGHENANTDRLKGRYADPKQPALRVDVKAAAVDLQTIRLD
jgi:hypothetical protein